MKDALIYVQRFFQYCTSGRKSAASSSGAHLYKMCRQFSLEEIKAATKNFHKDQKIGQGGFGNVYKGFIDNGTVAVAVKRLLMSSFQGTIEFKNEVQFLCQLRHPNLVSLIGFCTERNEFILVYEYMHNRNLSLYIFVTGGGDSLSWEQRVKICIAVACALHYLHAGVKYAVIHGDVKSFNILLDENWIPKLSDFGVSKLEPRSMSKKPLTMESRVVGTFGYMAPEFVQYGQLSEKCDVFSFGVVLLEVLCARRVHINEIGSGRSLIEQACECIENGSINVIMDTYLEGKVAPESLQKFVEIARECVRMEGTDRPSIGKVEVTLELVLELQEKA